MDYFIEYYRNINRKGPGDDHYTEMAFRLLEGLPPNPKILDIGCGSGLQSIALAKMIDCEITAVDYYDYFLDELAENIKKEKLWDRIKPVKASMFELPFEDHEFDVIWAEGAIYIIGFENGLREWKRLLKPNGYLVATDISWIRNDVPKAAHDFWTAAYPDVSNISKKIAIIEHQGYQSLAHLTLPEYGWMENYYLPLEARKASFLETYGHVPEAVQVVKEEFDTEFEIYKKYKEFFSYVYYIIRKL